MKRSFVLVSMTLVLLSSQAMANSIGVGIGYASEYPGSGEYVFSPNAAFTINTPIGIVKNNDIGAQLDIIESTSFDTGPVVRVNFGRTDAASDDVVAALPEVATAAELGWFIGSGFKLDKIGIPSDAIVIGKLTAVTDVADGHGGTQITGSVGVVFQLSDNFRLVPSLGFNFVDDTYAESFYGVSSGGAFLSGLEEFTAGGGLEYTQAALFAVRTIDKHWSVTGTIAFNKLQEDAAASPITQRGTDEQLFAGFILNYKL